MSDARGGNSPPLERWLFISHEATNSGAPRMLLEVLRGIRAVRGESWQCEMIFGQGGTLFNEFARLGPVHRLSRPWTDAPNLWSRGGRWLGRRLWLRSKRFAQLVSDWQTRGGGVIFSNTGINGRLLAALPPGRHRLVSYVHELATGLRRFNRPADLAVTLTRTDLFLAVSTAVSADLAELGVQKSQIELVPNFLRRMPAASAFSTAHAELCRQLQLPSQTRLITGCGHIERVKGPDFFVEMANQVAQSASGPLTFLWLGRAADRALSRRVRASAGDRVRFLGEVADTMPYFAGSDIVAVTSRNESFSRVALEAGALGRPVLAFAGARGPSDLLSPECLMTAMSGSAMATAVMHLLDHPAEASRLGTELRARIADRFLAEHWVEKLISLVESGTHA
jgi:glycosyltransferase involved in cell wall biosynthesis